MHTDERTEVLFPRQLRLVLEQDVSRQAAQCARLRFPAWRVPVWQPTRADDVLHTLEALLMLVRSIPVFLALLTAPLCLAQQSSNDGPLNLDSTSSHRPTRLTNDSIVRMSKAGLDAALILQTIRTQPGEYTTGPDDLIYLKEQGVPQNVIAAMVARSSGLVEHVPDPVSVTPLSPDLDEQGVYHKDRDGKWVPVPPELVKYKSGGWVKSTLTDNIVKKDRNGEVSGAQSSLILKPGDELEIVAPPNTDAIEYQLLRFRLHPNSREFRAQTGGVFNSHDGVERDQVTIAAKRIAPRIFAFTIPLTIGGGEFGVLPPGSASVPGIAFAGKIYTFAITVDK